MRPAGRLAAAIEVLDTVLARYRPAALALGDWGKAHRFAGSGDRAAIGNLVYDALRQRLTLGWAMGEDSPRALALAAAATGWALAPEAIQALCGEPHGPTPLSDAEQAGLARIGGAGAADHVRANIPEWLWPAFTQSIGTESIGGDADVVAEGLALAARAPLDLRVNTLKSDRDSVLKELEVFAAIATPWSPLGVRIAPPATTGRTPNVQAEPGFLKGWFELQDEGSQIASVIAARAADGHGQVLDLCAGGGGKALALAAALGNKGQIFAYDSDKHRLKPIHDRLQRAGTRNVQVLNPRPEALQALLGTMGTVVIDAPCSGAGAWRRRPETKWRLTPEALAARVGEQAALLDQALTLLKPDGRIVYITCSLLAAENTSQIAAFLGRHAGWQARSGSELAQSAFADGPAPPALNAATGLTLLPGKSGTDGFFIAVLQRGG